jgi:uncharacterized membrane protein
VQVVLRAERDPSQTRSVVVPVRSVPAHPALEVEGPNGTLRGEPGHTLTVPLRLSNPGAVPLDLALSVPVINGTWNWGFVSIGNLTTNTTVLPWSSTNVTFVVSVPSTAPVGQTADFVIAVEPAGHPAVARTVHVHLEAQTA